MIKKNNVIFFGLEVTALPRGIANHMIEFIREKLEVEVIDSDVNDVRILKRESV